MKIYLINLDRAPERLYRMQKLFDSLDLEFERFSAIDARNFTQDDLQKFTCPQEGKIPFSLGDHACTSSHIECLKKIAAGDDEYGAIIEDDIHLSKDAADYLKGTSWIPTDTNIVKLETFRKVVLQGKPVKKLPRGRKLSRLMSLHLGTGLYIISKKAAQFVVQRYRPYADGIDGMLFGELVAELKIYQMSPAIAIQDNIAGFETGDFMRSDIAHQRSGVAIKMKGPKKLKREVKRAVKIANDYLTAAYLLIVKSQRWGKISYKP